MLEELHGDAIRALNCLRLLFDSSNTALRTMRACYPDLMYPDLKYPGAEYPVLKTQGRLWSLFGSMHSSIGKVEIWLIDANTELRKAIGKPGVISINEVLVGGANVEHMLSSYSSHHQIIVDFSMEINNSCLLNLDSYLEKFMKVVNEQPPGARFFEIPILPDKILTVDLIDELIAKTEVEGRKAITLCKASSMHEINQTGGLVPKGVDSVNSESLPTHSPDFTEVTWYGEKYLFKKTQALCVEVLWSYWEAGDATARQSTILADAGSVSDRLRDVFDKGKHPAWNTMIQSPVQGGYGLVAPDKKD